MTTDRPTRAEIDLSALHHNYLIARQLSDDTKMMALVKAEAYGHGLIPISRAFVEMGVDYLGVSFLEEGIELREAGVNAPILVMGGLVDEQIERYLDYNLEITVSSVWKATHVDQVAASRRVKAKVQLKFDTGMGRIGQSWQTADQFLSEIARLKHLSVKGIYSHLATADEDLKFARVQLDRFNEIIETARKIGLDPPSIHIANSGGLIQLGEQSHFNMIRPGLMLYGYSPGLTNLKPVMTLKSRVVYVKKPPKGSTIGYGATYLANGDNWIATLPIGYGDGYPRRAGNRAWVMMNGRPCPIVGRVSMDMITIDAGPEAYLGDEAILFGGHGENRVDLWELSKQLDTIPYELMCGLTARVQRVYI